MPMSSDGDRSPLDVGHLTSPWPVHVIDATASTNADLLRAAAAGAPEQVLVAELQSAGRGRLDRQWTSPLGAGLTFSMLVRPAVALPSLPLVGLAAGVAFAQVLAVGLKWPNDLVSDDLKLGGILIETTQDSDGLVAVVGAGINVTTTAAELPVPGATSLALLGRPRPRGELLAELVTEFHGVLSQWSSYGDAWLVARYRALCTTLGRRVQAQLPSGENLVGLAVEVDLSGQLAILTAEGTRRVAAGDIVHLRPH